MLIDTSAKDTIYARSSADGRGGVHVFRLSGPDALSTACLLTKRTELTPRFAHYAAVYAPKTGELIDTGLVIYFPGPKSFTGEDVVEYHLHGSLAVEKALFHAFSEFKPLRPAEQGEFTLRAFLNGKIDLLEAEGLADLIDADTEAERKLALRQSQGELSQTFSAWRDALLEVLALTEATIDFSDEEAISEGLTYTVRENLGQLITRLTDALNGGPLGEMIKRGLVVTLSGAPNTGKSSLLNALVKYEKAIVTDQAGTTRDLIEADLEIEGLRLRLIDGAGLRETRDPIEAEGVRRAETANQRADLILWLIDPQAPVFPDINTPFIDRHKLWLVTNKSDLGMSTNIPECLEALPLINISARSGEHLELLREKLGLHCRLKTASADDGLLIQQRHARHLKAIKDALEDALATDAVELMAEHLRQAVQHIGKLTGQITIEHVLDKIFSRFCLGK